MLDITRECLESLLNNQRSAHILNLVLQFITDQSNTNYGFIAGIRQNIDGGYYYRYYSVKGLTDKNRYWSDYQKNGYYDDTSHHMMFNFTKDSDGMYMPIIKNNIERKYLEDHPNVKNLLVLPLISSKTNGHLIGSLALSSDKPLDSSCHLEYKKYQTIAGIWLQICVNRDDVFMSKNSFLANISHELRTPLSGIINIAQFFDNMNMPLEQRKYIDMINNCSIQLMDIVNDILDYTKISSGSLDLILAPFDIYDSIRFIVSIIESKQKPGVALKKDIASNIPVPLLGDSTRFAQILINIMENSVKFTREGEITLTVKYTEPGHIFIVVQDTGCGIESHRLNGIFDSIGQFNPNYLISDCGVGLGLPISKYLINLHDGDIQIQSQVNVGTTVSYDLYYTDDIVERLTDIFNDKLVLLSVDDSETRDKIFRALVNIKCKPIVADSSSITIYIQQKQVFGFEIGICDPKIYTKSFLDKYDDITKWISVGQQVHGLTTIEAPVTNNNIYKCLSKLGNTIERMPTSIQQQQIKHDQSNNEDSAPLQHSNYSLLIAEDDEQSLIILKLMLEKLGYTNIKTVDNGILLYTELISDNIYDLIFVDLMMPMLDGISAVKNYYTYLSDHPEKKRNKEHTIIIALTASVSEETRDQCYKAGMNGYLTKPVRKTDLSKLDKVLKHK